MSYIGDFRLGETFDTKFCTTAAATGAPTTLAGTPVISAYVGNSTTQITAGITLSVDFDGVTGLHNVRVVATSGNGYATASNYQLVITTGTVGGTSAVGYVIAEFSIEARSALMPTTAARTLDVSAGGEAGIDWANIGSPTTAQNLSATNIDVDQVVASVSGAVGSVTATVNANAIQISGDTTAADNIEIAFDDTAGAVPHMGILDQGTAQSATGNDIVLRAGNSHANDTLIGATIMVLGSTQGYWQSALITDSVLATDTITVTPNAGYVTPSGTITYKIFATAASSGGSGPTAAEVADAVWDEAQADHVAAGSFGEVATEVAAILVDTGTTLDGRIPAALVSGRMDCSVGAMAANVMTAAAAAADLTTELQSGLATAAALATVDGIVDDILLDTAEIGAAGAGLTVLATQASVNTIDDFLDTEVAAIKAKTDSLTFTVANVLDANVQRINDVAITGDGQVGTEFGV
jgi:hypothetical protein